MADLPAIDDSNTYAAKTDDVAVPSGEEATHVSAADLNNIKAALSANRAQANTALSTALAIVGGGDVVGPASAVDDRITTFDGVTGKLIQDSGVTIGAIATAQAAASAAASAASAAATTADAAAPKIQAVRLVTANTVVSASQNREFLVVDMATGGGADIGVGFQSSCTSGHVERVMRTWVSGSADPGGTVLFVSASGTHNFQGADRLTGANEVATLTCLGVDGSMVHQWSATVETVATVASAPRVLAAHTTSTRTLAATDAGAVLPLDPTSNAIAITIPHTLYGALGDDRAFHMRLTALNVINAITFAGSGGLVLTYYGSSTITAGDIIRISVESATACRVEVIATGDAAGAHIASTSNPHSVTAAQVGADSKTTVQTAHTTATLTLADADHNQHRALNTASNSIAISIPDDLTFPFVWTARKSSASNSVSITTGAGLITPKVSGTVPVTDVDAWITVFAESSTVAVVFVTVAA